MEETRDLLHDIVGKLRFLADRTRPDLLSAVNALGSAAARPGKEHVRAARRILRYVKGSIESDLVLGGASGLIPVGFCDASYTGDGDSKSQYGYCIHLNRTWANIIKSKTSTVIPHSPCKAKSKRWTSWPRRYYGFVCCLRRSAIRRSDRRWFIRVIRIQLQGQTLLQGHGLSTRSD
jgi:hypothetical protein